MWLCRSAVPFKKSSHHTKVDVSRLGKSGSLTLKEGYFDALACHHPPCGNQVSQRQSTSNRIAPISSLPYSTHASQSGDEFGTTRSPGFIMHVSVVMTSNSEQRAQTNSFERNNSNGNSKKSACLHDVRTCTISTNEQRQRA